MTGQAINEPELLTDGGLAEFLKVSIQSVRRLAKDPSFPRPMQVGRFRRWEKNVVLEYYRAKSGPVEEVTPNAD